MANIDAPTLESSIFDFMIVSRLHGGWKHYLSDLPSNTLKDYKGAIIPLKLVDEMKQNSKLRETFGVTALEVNSLVEDQTELINLMTWLSAQEDFKGVCDQLSILEPTFKQIDWSLKSIFDSRPSKPVVTPKKVTKLADKKVQSVKEDVVYTAPIKAASASEEEIFATSEVKSTDGNADAEKAAIKALKELLADVNGQDAYDVELAGVAPLSKSDYLILPGTLKARLTNFPIKDIGLSKLVNEAEWAQIVWLNALSIGKVTKISDVRKPHLVSAMLRAYLVELGYCNLGDDGKARYVTCNEITFVNSPVKVHYKELNDVIDNFGIKIAPIKALACYAPSMMSSHFLKTGHHFLSGVSPKYYEKLFNSCMIQGLANILPFDILFHQAMHWIGPANARSGWENIIKHEKPIKALELRFNSSPAGSALITTSYAVMQHIARFERFAYAATYFKERIDKVKVVVDKINLDATVYSQNYKLFGHRNSPLNSKEYLDAVEAAKTISVICQAYIETISKGTRLASAKVLKNHADDNIMVKKSMISFFKAASEDIGDIKTMKNAIHAYFGEKDVPVTPLINLEVPAKPAKGVS